MAQRVDGHPPSDNSDKTRRREASIMTRCRNLNAEVRMAKKNKARFCSLVICHSSSFGICHSSFLLYRFRSAILLSLELNFKIVEVTTQNASPHLVSLRRLSRRLCRQGAHAYASIDHVDGRARYCRLDHWRCRDPPVLSAQRRGQISSRRNNCIHHWSDSRFVHLAQVQTAIATRIERQGTTASWPSHRCRLPPSRGYGEPWEAVIPCKAQIDLYRFDFRLGLRSLALSEL